MTERKKRETRSVDEKYQKGEGEKSYRGKLTAQGGIHYNEKQYSKKRG